MADINVGGVQATVTLDAKQFDAGIKQVVASLQSMQQSFQQTQTNIASRVSAISGSITKNTKIISADLKDVSSSVKDMGRDIHDGLEILYLELNNISKGITNSTNVIKKSVDGVGTSTKAISTHIIALKKSIENSFKSLIKEIHDLVKAFKSLDIVTSKDFSKGMRDLEKNSNRATTQVVGGLNKIDASAKQVTNTLKNMSINATYNFNLPARDLSMHLASANKEAQNLASTSSGLWGIFQKVSFNAFLLKQGVSQIADMLGGWITPGIEFNKMLETESYGMAGILMSMTDVNGRAWDFNEALGYGNDIIKKMNKEAIKTAATTGELVSTFRALLGPGLGAGMSIDQIQQFTVVGVNAVKSMGLEGRQLVQELRDLVQGGIQAASSTLATALGLKDKDIKAAKASSEGLFKFLMKRLQGFDKVAQEFPKTLQGAMAVVGEGFTVALAEAEKPIVDLIKHLYDSVKNVIFTDAMEINPEFLNTLTSIVEHALKLYDSFVEVGKVLYAVVQPALSLAGTLLGAMCDNATILIYLFGAWTLAKNIASVTSLTNAITGSKNATTGLLSSLNPLGAMFTSVGARAKAMAQIEMNNAKMVADKELATIAERKQAAQQLREIRLEAIKQEQSGNQNLANSLRGLVKEYRNLGLSATESIGAAHKAMVVLQQSTQKTYENVVKTTQAHLQGAKTFEDNASVSQTLVQGTWAAVSAVTGLAEAYKLCTDESNKEGRQIADNIEKWAFAVGGIATLIGSLSDLGKAFTVLRGLAIKAWAAVFAPVTVGVGTIVAGCAVVAGAIYGIQKALQSILDIDDNELYKRYFYTKAERDKDREFNETYSFDDYGTLDDNKTVTKKDFGGSTDDKEAKKKLRNAYKDLERDLQNYQEILKGYSTSLKDSYNNDLVATSYYVERSLAIQLADLNKQEEILKKKLELAKANGSESDVEKFNDELEKVNTKRRNAEIASLKQLGEEYKKLDSRLIKITGSYQKLVGESEKVFQDNLVREVANDYSRLNVELEYANGILANVKDDKQLEIWQKRKQRIEEALAAEKKYIEIKGIQRMIDQESAKIESRNLAINDKFIEQQSLVKAGSLGSLSVEYELWRERQRGADDTINSYQIMIKGYEELIKKAKEDGDLAKENSYTKRWQEAKKAMLDFANELSPVRKEIQSALTDGFSDAYQNILWGEKDFITAFSDMWKNLGKQFTKRIFDEAFKGTFDNMFDNLFPDSKIKAKAAINAEVNVDTTKFVETITNAARKFKTDALDTLATEFNALRDAANQAAQALGLISGSGVGSGDGKGTVTPNLPNNAVGATEGSIASDTIAKTDEASISIGSFNDKIAESYDTYLTGFNSTISDATTSLFNLSTSVNSSLNKGVMDLTGSINSGTVAEKKNQKATGDQILAAGLMATSLIGTTSASEKLQKAMIILQGVLMAMQIAKSFSLFGFASGGKVTGPGTGTSDSITARLSNGEYVMKADTVRKYGADFFDSLNYGTTKHSGRLPRFAFADGGLVEKSDYSESSDSMIRKGGESGGTVVNMNMTFQSLDPESNMKMMEAQYPTIRQKLLRDLQGNSMVRSAVRGVR